MQLILSKAFGGDNSFKEKFFSEALLNQTKSLYFQHKPILFLPLIGKQCTILKSQLFQLFTTLKTIVK